MMHLRTKTFPSLAAKWKAFSPSASSLWMSAPCCINFSVISTSPLIAAWCNGVMSPLSWMLMSMFFWSKSSLAISVFPRLALKCNAVQPYMSCVFIEAPLETSSLATATQLYLKIILVTLLGYDEKYEIDKEIQWLLKSLFVWGPVHTICFLLSFVFCGVRAVCSHHFLVQKWMTKMRSICFCAFTSLIFVNSGCIVFKNIRAGAFTLFFRVFEKPNFYRYLPLRPFSEASVWFLCRFNACQWEISYKNIEFPLSFCTKTD